MPLPVPGDRQRLIEARALLEQNYGQEWSLQSLARAVGLNEKRLQQGFQALYGCSVHACLTRIRLNAAVAMLKRGTSVTETAACCGFANLSHFSRMFRGHTGITPKQCALGISPRIVQQDAPPFLLWSVEPYRRAPCVAQAPSWRAMTMASTTCCEASSRHEDRTATKILDMSNFFRKPLARFAESGDDLAREVGLQRTVSSCAKRNLNLHVLTHHHS